MPMTIHREDLPSAESGEEKRDERHAQSHEESETHADHARRPGARGTAAMDPQTRQEVARKGGLAVSRNRAHMAEIGRKGGQSVSKNREHMAKIGRKGGAASRGPTRGPEQPGAPMEEPEDGSSGGSSEV
jgi:general stress protein YciG